MSKMKRREMRDSDLDFLRHGATGDLPNCSREMEARIQAGELERLPIDDVLAGLIDRRDARGRALHPRITRESAGDRCPFALARWFIPFAVNSGNMRYRMVAALAKERATIERRLKDVAAAREALAAIALWDEESAARDDQIDVQGYFRGDRAIWRQDKRSEDKGLERAQHYDDAHTRAVGGLQDLRIVAAILKERHGELESPRGAPHLIWRREFIEGMGFLWRRLTGSNPPRSDHFYEFVASAFHSIGGAQDLEWHRAVRTTLAEIDERPAGEGIGAEFERALSESELSTARAGSGSGGMLIPRSSKVGRRMPPAAATAPAPARALNGVSVAQLDAVVTYLAAKGQQAEFERLAALVDDAKVMERLKKRMAAAQATKKI